MQTHAAITIAQAAKQLGIGSRTLFQLLREAGVLSEQNIATRAYVVSGELRNEHRSAFKTGTRIQRWYTVPMVTGNGMALLQEIVSAVGTQGQMVVAERLQPLPNQCGDCLQPDDVRRLGISEPDMGTARHTPRR